MISAVAPGQTGWLCATIELSMMSRWISGMTVVTSVATREAPNATSVRRSCRQQYAASRRSQPSP